MMSKTLLVCCFLAAFCGSDAIRVRREENAVEILKEDVQKAIQKAQEAGEQIAKMIGIESLPSGEDIIHIIKNQTKLFADNAEQIQKQLEQEIKQISGTPVGEVFTDLSKRIGETVVGLREQLEASGVAEKAADLQGKFQDGINTLLEESRKVIQTLEPQVAEVGKELEKLTKKVLEGAVENVTQLQDKIHTATGQEAQ